MSATPVSDALAPPCPVARPAALSMERVSRRYGDHDVLHAIDLTVGAGEFVSLLGPSGSGKTTILRLIAGFDMPTGGCIRIGGRDMTGVAAHQRPVGVVFQNLALFPHLTVGGNVAFGLEVRRTTRAETSRRVADTLRLVELPGLQDRRIHELSGGQRQRVALARALVLDPDLLLLDEPLSALDLKLRQTLQDELKRIQRRTRATFVFVTHDQDEALRLSDRIAVVNRGRIEQVGSAEDIYDRPRSAFVAHFIGDTNLFAGRVMAARSGQATIELDGLGTVTAPCFAPLMPGAAASLSVRPENMAVGDLLTALPAIVTEVAYGGARIRTALDAGGRTVLADMPVRPGEHRRHGPGSAVFLDWNAAHCVIVPTGEGEPA